MAYKDGKKKVERKEIEFSTKWLVSFIKKI